MTSPTPQRKPKKERKNEEGKEDIFWGESDAEKLIPLYEERNRRRNAYIDSKKNDIFPKRERKDGEGRWIEHKGLSGNYIKKVTPPTLGRKKKLPTLENPYGDHETHFACEKMLNKYGDKTLGCCCSGHKCKPPKSSEVWFTPKQMEHIADLLTQQKNKIRKWTNGRTITKDSLRAYLNKL